jgi:hypothetical protein
VAELSVRLPESLIPKIRRLYYQNGFAILQH